MNLKDWLRQHQYSPHAFAKKIRIVPQTMYNAISGKEMSYSIICKIVDATKGEVGYTDLLPETLPLALRKRLMALADTRQHTPDGDTEKKRKKKD